MPDLVSPRLLGVELSYAQLSVENDDGTISFVGVDISGQARVVPGFFVFGQLPMIYANGEGTEDTEADLGNLKLGARYAGEQGGMRYGLDFVLGLPTAPEPGEGDQGIAALLSAFGRFDSFGKYMPEVTTISLQAHLRRDLPRYFLQGQFAWEHFRAPDEDEGLDLVRVVLGAGFKLSNQMALIGELTNISMHLEDEGDEKLFHWLRMGARYQASPQMTVGGHLYATLDGPAFLIQSNVWGLAVDLQLRL